MKQFDVDNFRRAGRYSLEKQPGNILLGGLSQNSRRSTMRIVSAPFKPSLMTEHLRLKKYACWVL